MRTRSNASIPTLSSQQTPHSLQHPAKFRGQENFIISMPSTIRHAISDCSSGTVLKGIVHSAERRAFRLCTRRSDRLSCTCSWWYCLHSSRFTGSDNVLIYVFNCSQRAHLAKLSGVICMLWHENNTDSNFDEFRIETATCDCKV